MRIRRLIGKILPPAVWITGLFLLQLFFCVPSSVTVRCGERLSVPSFFTVHTLPAGFTRAEEGVSARETGEYTVSFSFGPFVRESHILVRDKREVLLGGEVVGIKLYMDGVLVCGMSEIPGTAGLAPGRDAGLTEGDRIVAINGVPCAGSDDLEKAICESGGAPLRLSVMREKTAFETTAVPAYYADGGAYRLGIWVKESEAGLGTLTFSIPETGTFAALGHFIADADTGTVVRAKCGSITDCRIDAVEKSENGMPGELCGTLFDENIGEIYENGDTGLFGRLEKETAGERISVASAAEVEKGEALIYSAASGEKCAYTVKIEHIGERNGTKNLRILVTDERLLSLCGGIVQGMSGSPIVQNGKLVGAVTHVFVNDTRRGYGILAENMLEAAEKTAEK